MRFISEENYGPLLPNDVGPMPDKQVSGPVGLPVALYAGFFSWMVAFCLVTDIIIGDYSQLVISFTLTVDSYNICLKANS